MVGEQRAESDQTVQQEVASTTSRLSWPRYRRDDGTPIVGWTCDNCGHEVEAPYKPARLARCPNCGGNQNGVRSWSVEEFVEDRRERLLAQLAQHHGLDEFGDPDVYECEVCGTTDDVHICPGPELDDLQYRCDDCRRFPKYWWQPGEHPSLLTRRWIETCDDCGAEFTGLFGVTFWIEHENTVNTGDYCLRCAEPERVRHYLEVV